MRAAARFSTGRESIVCDFISGSMPESKRLDLVLHDVSATGCRATGVGRPLQVDDVVKLRGGSSLGSARWLTTRVRRVTMLAFGRWEVGFSFDLKTPEERLWLLEWRDSLAQAQADARRSSGFGAFAGGAEAA
jgi:hypothetical protein